MFGKCDKVLRFFNMLPRKESIISPLYQYICFMYVLSSKEVTLWLANEKGHGLEVHFILWITSISFWYALGMNINQSLWSILNVKKVILWVVRARYVDYDILIWCDDMTDDNMIWVTKASKKWGQILSWHPTL